MTLIDPGVMDRILMVALLIAIAAFAISAWNFFIELRRLRRLSLRGLLDEDYRLEELAKDTVAAGLGGMVVAALAITFNTQALLGEFNLAADWSSGLFLACINAGAINNLAQGIRKERMRRRLDRRAQEDAAASVPQKAPKRKRSPRS